MHNQEHPLNIDMLPDETLLTIFSFLSPSDLAQVSQVSKKWKKFAEDDLLWIKLLEEPSKARTFKARNISIKQQVHKEHLWKRTFYMVGKPIKCIGRKGAMDLYSFPYKQINNTRFYSSFAKDIDYPIFTTENDAMNYITAMNLTERGLFWTEKDPIIAKAPVIAKVVLKPDAMIEDHTITKKSGNGNKSKELVGYIKKSAISRLSWLKLQVNDHTYFLDYDKPSRTDKRHQNKKSTKRCSLQ